MCGGQKLKRKVPFWQKNESKNMEGKDRKKVQGASFHPDHVPKLYQIFVHTKQQSPFFEARRLYIDYTVSLKNRYSI